MDVIKSSRHLKINIELFCGSSGFTKVSRALGIECISIDNRRRLGTCEPSLKLDINKVPGTFFKSMPIFCMWVGLPCDIWSNASGGFHLDSGFQPKTRKAKEHLQLADHVINLIIELKKNNPDFYFFIENPDGKFKKYPGLSILIEKCAAHIYECTLSSYGFPTTKPTIIISNFPHLKLKEKDPFGRGHRNKVPRAFNNMTKTQRQKTPEKLYKDILKQVLTFTEKQK